METKTFSFITNSMNYEEIGSKSDKEYYVKGYISTDEVDRANEVVTREAMNGMVSQIKAGNVKLDIEHSTFAGDNDIPVGRIVDAGMDDKGVWVKCTLNRHHSKFGEIWKSIKDGFLDAFSIAYKVTNTAREVINGTQVTLLKGLELLNVAITGNPVCRGARMSESFYKSLKYNVEVKNDKMVDEIVETPAPVVEEVKEEPKVEAVVEPETEEVIEEKAEKKVVEPKVEETPEEKKKKKEDDKEDSSEPRPLDTIKSMNKEIAELKAEVKSLNKIINKPQMKAIASTDIAEVKSEVEFHSPLQAIK